MNLFDWIDSDKGDEDERNISEGGNTLNCDLLVIITRDYKWIAAKDCFN